MTGKNQNRSRAIIQTSWLGIAANFVLSAFKLLVGYLANSVSVIADGINNVTDALSSAITIIGTKLSDKKPDRKHPFGYGRVEYLSSLIIGIIILYAGFDMLKNSIQKIIHPEANDYSVLTLVVISVAILVKVAIGIYTKKKGKQLDSEALTASGKDALNDVIASSATLVAAIVYMTTKRSIEAWVGAGISLLILKAGVETILETAGHILGKSTELELATAVRESIASFPEVEGVYDLVIHSYGKRSQLGSAHIEVYDSYKVAWIDNLQRAITKKVREDTGVEMLGLTIYAINTHSEKVIAAREAVRKIVMETEGARQMHGFYIDMIDRTMNFDIVVEFGAPDEEIRDGVKQKVLALYPEYDLQITIDHDFTE